jgi:hypothetical protein
MKNNLRPENQLQRKPSPPKRKQSPSMGGFDCRQGATQIVVAQTPIDIDYVTKAFVGVASPLLGVITSLQEQVEWTLRVASLCVGLAVGIMSLVSMVKKMRGR